MSKRTESEQQHASAVNRARVQQGLSKRSACSIGRSKESKARAQAHRQAGQVPEPIAAETIGAPKLPPPTPPKAPARGVVLKEAVPQTSDRGELLPQANLLGVRFSPMRAVLSGSRKLQPIPTTSSSRRGTLPLLSPILARVCPLGQEE